MDEEIIYTITRYSEYSEVTAVLYVGTNSADALAVIAKSSEPVKVEFWQGGEKVEVA